MRVEIRIRGIQQDQEFENHVERRMRFALARFSGRIDAVKVIVTDENGPRGGVDKRCLLSVKLASSKEVVVVESGLDPYSTFERATDRLSRQVARELSRRSWSRSMPVQDVIEA